MHRYEFKPDDLFVNRLKTYPEYNIFIYQGEMFVNRDSRISGSGGIVVYDVNTNRTDSADKIYPFVMTGSEKAGFKIHQYQPLVKQISGDHFFINKYYLLQTGQKAASSTDSRFSANGEVSSSYGFESPIKRSLTSRRLSFQANFHNIVSGITDSQTIQHLEHNLTSSALQNVARKYTTLSDHFILVSSSVRPRDLVYGTEADNLNFIFIPSMYYGSTIKKGSVELNYYITGSKIASCADINHNGTLIGTTGSTSGSVVGLVMYDEGVIMLTSSVELESNDIEYVPSTPTSGSWLYYGTTLNDSTGSTNTLASASYDLNFKGTSYVNSMTMFAHARKGHLNHSNNPTYKDLSFTPSHQTGSGKAFVEGDSPIANIVSGSYVSASFDKTTYISKVHIYDEDGNLIAITSMASPVKKTLEDEFTFKMKLDL